MRIRYYLQVMKSCWCVLTGTPAIVEELRVQEAYRQWKQYEATKQLMRDLSKVDWRALGVPESDLVKPDLKRLKQIYKGEN